MNCEQKNICPVCGSDFSENPVCPECYVKFFSQLENTLTALYGKPHHRGKAPSRVSTAAVIEQKIAELKKELAEVIRNENFERACMLRDSIRELEEEKNVMV